MKKTSTRRSLILSALSLIMCVSMFIGTTYAWFTDSVTSGRNIIQSGNLDVELYYFDDATDAWVEVDSNTNVFGYNLWEPGFTKVIKLKVVNVGSLDLKYQLSADIYSETDGTNAAGASFKLSDYIRAALVADDATRDDILALEGVKFNENLIISGNSLAALEATDPDSEDVYNVALWMPTTVGNDANHNGEDIPSIEFGINLFATQLASEEDSFNETYDEDAILPSYVRSTASGSAPLDMTTGNITVTIPAGNTAGEYELTIDNYNEIADASNNVSLSFDVHLTKDGVKVENTAGIAYEVTVNIGYFNGVSKLFHKGEEITDFTYDAISGLLTFTTADFSPFEIIFKEYNVTKEGNVYILNEDVDTNSFIVTDDIVIELNDFSLSVDAIEGNGNISFEVTNGNSELDLPESATNVQIKISSGTYDKNPALIDPSLKADGSKYIAIDYPFNGTTYYRVVERENTVVVAPTAVTAENGNYDVVAGNGKLYSIISGLQNNDFSRVFLLPGTYNEGTTINVYSSMDIEGLGDKDSIKVIKTSSSNSNRHLFNCSGTKAEYIQVTLRNLYLDATAKTTGGKDNAAVQSIRKSKVKCYDLTIVKSANDMSQIAFYVNGNNAVDGVKYPAYLYAENCSLNSTKSFSVVSTAGSYKFYHSDVTYGGNDYTTNSASIKNIKMEADDWDW